jgi:hypothetical protein
VTAAVFTLIFTLLVFHIGTYPAYFDDFLGNAVVQSVNLALDGVKYPDDVTWLWTDMNQDWAGKSPIFFAVSFIGIKFFGLTLFGIRIVGALLAFPALILTYFTLNKFRSKLFSLLFITLLVSSPWYLSPTRSGGVVGLSLTMTLSALCFTALLFQPSAGARKWVHGLLLPLIAGVSAAILPYGYSITRIIPIVLMICVWIHIKRIGVKRVIIYTLAVLAVVSVQFTDFKHSIAIYFNGRGETLFAAAKAEHDGLTPLGFILTKLTSNIWIVAKYFLGLNKPAQFFDVPIADSYWSVDMFYIPNFLRRFLSRG